MPRAKGSKNKKGSGTRFKEFEGRYPTDKHIRITADMMNDTAYLNLSSSAKVLYSYMKLWACGNSEVVYTASMAKAFMSERNFYRVRDELIKGGFITSLNSHRNKPDALCKSEAGEYQFSGKWMIGKMIE